MSIITLVIIVLLTPIIFVTVRGVIRRRSFGSFSSATRGLGYTESKDEPHRGERL